jgi:secreted Zn-dependent insulinase-like peptidase
LPNCHTHHHKTQPLSYFTSIFGSEQNNSVFSHLKQEGLIMSLNADSDGEFNGVYSTLYVDAKLTKKGLLHSEEVLSVIFKQAQYLKD